MDDKLNLLQQVRRSVLERKEYLQEKIALVQISFIQLQRFF